MKKMTKKYFYEKSKFKEFVSNITYHQLYRWVMMNLLNGQEL